MTSAMLTTPPTRTRLLTCLVYPLFYLMAGTGLLAKTQPPTGQTTGRQEPSETEPIDEDIWWSLRKKYPLVDIRQIDTYAKKPVDPNVQPWLDALESLGYSETESRLLIMKRQQTLSWAALDPDKIGPPKSVGDPRRAPEQTDRQPDSQLRVRAGTVSTGTFTTITEEQAESVLSIKPENWLVFQFDSLTSITDEQARIFGQLYGFTLSLNGLTSLTDDQAANLAKFRGGPTNGITLSLDGITSLTDRQAASLATFAGTLSLNGLTSLTDSQAESFANQKGVVGNQSRQGTPSRISLNGLTSLSDSQAQSLGRIQHLSLDGLISISPEQLKNLTQNGFNLVGKARVDSENYLSLAGLKSLTDAQADALSQSLSRTTFRLSGLESLTEKQAEFLGNIKLTPGGSLALNGLKAITDGQAASLSPLPQLQLDGLTAITDAQAASLGQLGGEYRTLLLIPNQPLSLENGINPQLSLNGLTAINETQAKHLASGLVSLRLLGLTSLTEHVPKALTKENSENLPDSFKALIEKHQKHTRPRP